MSNGNVRLEYNLAAGTTDFYWKDARKITGFYGGVAVGGSYIKGINYSSWSYSLAGSNQAVVTAVGAGLPTMKQYFILDDTNSFLTRMTVEGSGLSVNWIGPVVVDVTGGVDLGVANDNRALCVPFDNDHFVRYDAKSINTSGVSYEVAAFYDNATRNGLVVGSVEHDVWKTGIFFSGSNNKLNQMNVYGGQASPYDTMPHGSVTGSLVSSPTMFVGFGEDWRQTMERFAAANLHFAPKLSWTNGVPFGWNSWGVLQQSVNYTDVIAASDFFHTNLQPQGFSNGGTVYINLDSFWDNLSDSQLQQFVDHCHSNGQKAGIYWTPFVFWGTASQGSNWTMTATSYTWSQAYLRTSDGSVQVNDGGIAIDPTHPGFQQMANYYINYFTNHGFDFIKLDFLSHGALEGIHYNTNITTGIQAYNFGMSNLLRQINGRMFVSESIAPLFPYRYAHSRRIACDAQTSQIGNTEYTMNSVSYGWWLDNLYQFNDPDVMVFGNGTDSNEQQSRLISGAVTGLMLDGDDLTTTGGQQGAQACLTNAAINAVARAGQTFTPVEGNTGSSAANLFSRQDSANSWLIAVFNYTSSSASQTINLSRAGLPSGTYAAVNLWDGTTVFVTNSFIVSLNAKQSKLFRLTQPVVHSLRWSTNGNTGVWDTGVTANWINVSNSAPTVFNPGDQVLFDDSSGAPTGVTVSGTVAPSLIAIDSSTKDYTIRSGAIVGSGNLVKSGSSRLSILDSGSLSGSAVINGGSVYAGNGSFSSLAAITVTNNATLDVAGGNYNTGQPLTISGAGFKGQGAIVNSSNNYPVEVYNITMAGDSTFGGSARWDLGSGSTLNGPFHLTIDWSTDASNPYGEWNSVTVAANVAGVKLTNGSKLGAKNMDAGFQDPATVLTLGSNSQLIFWSGGWNGSLHVCNGAQVYLWTAPSAINGSTITLDDNAQWLSWSGSSDEPVNSAIILNGVAHMLIRDHNMIYTNSISGPGGFLLDTADHAMVLSASNTYNGPTIIGSVGNSPVVNLTGNGSIFHSSLIFLGGNDYSVPHLDVSGRSDKTLTLSSGQMLGGVGTINGSLIISPGATIAPAGTNTALGITVGANVIGRLRATDAVTLNGKTIIKLDGSAANDTIQAGTGITYGGTLDLVNVNGAPLAAGNSFPIFYAASYSGSFTNISPATPGAGLVWDLSQLNSGRVNVATAPSAPVISSIKQIGPNLLFSGTGGPMNAPYRVLTSTNVAAPLSNWTALSTNLFDASGNFSVTSDIPDSLPQRFYLICVP